MALDITLTFFAKNFIYSIITKDFGATWVSKEVENFKELKFLGLVHCFSVKIAQISKNLWTP